MPAGRNLIVPDAVGVEFQTQGVEMFDHITWTRGAGELKVVDTFAALAKKATKETGAEVLIVLQFPKWGEPHVVTSSPEHLQNQKGHWISSAVARGLRRLKLWLERYPEVGNEIEEEFNRLKSTKRT